MNTRVYDVTRSVDNPKGGDKIKRTAHVTIPVLYDREKNVVPTLDTIMSFMAEVAAVTGAKDPVEALGSIVQDAIILEARNFAYQELGKSDAVSKSIQKAIDAFKQIPILASKSDAELRAYVLAADPTLKEAFENQDVAAEVSYDGDVKRLFGDARKKEAESSEVPADSTSVAA